MRKLVILLVLCLSLQSVAQERFKFISYNVRNGNGMDGKRSYDRASGIVNREKPFVVALQEIDSVTKRSGGVDVLGEFARRTKMEGEFCKSIDFDGGKYGIGLLSDVKPLSVKKMSLPGREEARSLLVGEFEKFFFCVTHFSLTKEDQMRSVEIIDSLARGAKKPFFVAGDFNFSPKSQAFKRLKKGFDVLSDEKMKTCPADKPTMTIDYIVVGKGSGVKVLKKCVLDAPLESDHRPVLVEVEL